MMETDLPVCVLICLDVYLGLQCQQLVLNKQKSAVRIGSKHTLVDQFQSYDISESLEMCQHNIKALKLDLWHLRGQIDYFLLVLDQLLALETKISI